MDSGIYQNWIEDIDALSEAQREEVQKILAGRSSEAEVIAALEGRLRLSGCAHSASGRGPCAVAVRTACVGSTARGAARPSTP